MSRKEKDRTIIGKAYLDWLKGFGIIPEESRRVVIDIVADEAIIIYVEKYGTKKLLAVEPPPELFAATVITTEEING
jgi:hypothetical protein